MARDVGRHVTILALRPGAGLRRRRLTQGLAAGAGPSEEDGRVLHVPLGTDVAVERLPWWLPLRVARWVTRL